MRRNCHLIDHSDLLATIVEKIETSYADDISLLICYGSFVTGEFREMSDIDFFFVPRTSRGYELGHQFIVENIGYDLWPVSWERLSDISRLGDQPASILMDGEVLFAASEDDLRKLEDLKNNLLQKLGDESALRSTSAKYVEKAKVIYFGLADTENLSFLIDAMQIVETLLVAMAILNGKYLRKGLKRIEDELHRFSEVPAGFLQRYQTLIRTNDRTEIQRIVYELIGTTEELWKSRYDQPEENVDPSALAGFYEELKSTYNKVLDACTEKNYEQAYYASFMIDRDTRSVLANYTRPGAFSMMITALGGDFESIRDNCLEHERALLRLLNENGVKIHIYQDREEFRQSFLKKTI